jgi:hypothetical protein
MQAPYPMAVELAQSAPERTSTVKKQKRSEFSAPEQ